MAVNGNLGAGIAVAGSFSLIRFRSAQGTGQEILMVFLSAAAGLCLGAGYAAMACLLMVLCLLFHALLSAVGFGKAAENQREVRISLPENLDYEGLFDDLLGANFSAYELIRVRTVDMGAAYQLIYQGVLRDTADARRFLDAVRGAERQSAGLPGELMDTERMGSDMQQKRVMRIEDSAGGRRPGPEQRGQDPADPVRLSGGRRAGRGGSPRLRPGRGL